MLAPGKLQPQWCTRYYIDPAQKAQQVTQESKCSISLIQKCQNLHPGMHEHLLYFKLQPCLWQLSLASP